MNPDGELVLLLSPWGVEPAIKMKRGQAAQKFHPVNGHKFVAKVLFYSKNSFDWPVRAGFQWTCILCCLWGLHMGHWKTGELFFFIFKVFLFKTHGIHRASLVKAAKWLFTNGATTMLSIPAGGLCKNLMNYNRIFTGWKSDILKFAFCILQAERWWKREHNAIWAWNCTQFPNYHVLQTKILRSLWKIT